MLSSQDRKDYHAALRNLFALQERTSPETIDRQVDACLAFDKSIPTEARLKEVAQVRKDLQSTL